MDWLSIVALGAAVWVYAVGSVLMFLQTAFDHDPWWHRVLVVVLWPVLFPYALLFGRD